MRRMLLLTSLLLSVAGCGFRRDGADFGWEFRVTRPPVIVTRTPHLLSSQGESYGLTSLGARADTFAVAPPAPLAAPPCPPQMPIARSFPPPLPMPETSRPLTCEEAIEILKYALEIQSRAVPPPTINGAPPPGGREGCK